MATITGPTKRSGQQAIFILAIDWGEPSFLQYINREIVADTTELTSTNKHRAGPIRGEKIERCTGH